MRGEGRGGEGGAYPRGASCLLLLPRGWALFLGRALIRAWELIRGNMVSVSKSRESTLDVLSVIKKEISL